MNRMEIKKQYIRPATCPVDLYCAGLLAESGGSTGYEDKPGEDDVIFEQRRRNIWDSNDWLNSGGDNKEA